MKHVRKRSTTKELETCGIWLDTAQLKKRKVQTLLSKPASKVPNQLFERSSNSHISVNFTQTRVSQPCTRQSTISSFFSVQPTGEKDDENVVPCSLMSNKTHKGKGSGSFAASSMKNSGSAKLEHVQAPTFSPLEDNTQEYNHLLVQNTQGLNISLLKCTLPQAESLTKNGCTAIARTSAGDRGVPLSINFTQDSGDKRVLNHRNAADSFSGRVSVANGKISGKRENHWLGEDEGLLYSKREKTIVSLKPEHLKQQGRKRCNNLARGGISFMDFSEVENVSPTPKRNEGQQTSCPVSQRQKAKAEPLRDCQNFGSLWTNCYDMAGSAEEQGESQNSPATKLFTQDSEGYRVISHQDVYERISSLQKYSQDKPYSVHKGTTATSVGCFGVYSSEAWDRTPTALNLDEPQSCYDSLFTEDSEGNRIIKH